MEPVAIVTRLVFSVPLCLLTCLGRYRTDLPSSADPLQPLALEAEALAFGCRVPLTHIVMQSWDRRGWLARLEQR